MGRGRWTWWLSSTIVLVFTAGTLLAPLTVGVTPRPVAVNTATDSPPDLWAFHGSQVIAQSTTQGAVTVVQSGDYDWATLLTERSTGPFSVSLEVQRGMVAQYDYRLCTPSCASPTYSLTASMAGREWSVVFLNLTTTATALVGSGTVPSLGVQDLSVTGSWTEDAQSGVAGSSVSASSQAVHTTASTSFGSRFSPALALLPFDPVGSPSWNSAGGATSSGGWSRATSTTYSGLSSPNQNTEVQQMIPASSTWAIQGSNGGARTLSNGESVQSLSLSPSGGFEPLDGFLFVPMAADPFAAAGPVTVRSTGMFEDLPVLSYDVASSGHLGIAGSASTFQPAVAAPTGSASGPLGGSVTSYEPPAFPVQAQPESPASAAAAFQSWAFTPGAHSPAAVVPILGVSTVFSTPLVIGAAALAGLVVALGVRWRAIETPVPYSPRGPSSEVPRTSTTPAGPMAPGTAPPLPVPPPAPPRARDPFDDLL